MRSSLAKQATSAVAPHIPTGPVDHKGEPYNYSPFPARTDETVKVQMAQKQQHIHDYAMNKVPFWVRWKVRHGLPPTKKESGQLNAFMSASRQLSNTTEGYHKVGLPESPKIDAAFKRLTGKLVDNPRHRAVVYSTYIGSGLNPYKKKLTKAGIPFGEFSGEMHKHERNQMVKDYNEGKKPVLLISRAGAEGLDLKGTRQIQVLEPHWNEEHIKQVTGRGIRFKSHDHLPPHERHVHVERYLTKRRPHSILERVGLRKPGLSTDEYIQTMAHQKEEVNNQFRQMLAKQSKETGK